MKTRKIIITGMLLALLACTTACEDQYKKTVKGMTALAVANGELEKNVMAAQELKLLTEDHARQVLQVCKRVDSTLLQISAILKATEQLDAGSRQSVIDLLSTISWAIDPTKLEFIAGITNPETKRQVEAGFVLLRTLISSVQITLGVGGQP